jgi:hypothetical protein
MSPQDNLVLVGAAAYLLPLTVERRSQARLFGVQLAEQGGLRASACLSQ